jgi:hypothetical protein
MEQELQIYIDGKYYPKSEAKISVYDHGFLYGDGVFEGIRVYNGVVFKLKEHVKRLYDSAHALMLKIPISQGEMVKTVVETVKKNELKDSYVRLIVSRGVGDLGLDPRKCAAATVICIADKIKLHEGEAKIKGIAVMVSWVRRNPIDGSSHEVKSLNYLNSIMAKIEVTLWNSAISFSVTGPRQHMPMVRQLTSRMGTISAAVPVKKTSSALNNMYIVRFSTLTSMPSFLAIVTTALDVMPSSAPALVGGVEMTPFFTRNMFSPTPSATQPFGARQMASSAPLMLASIFAMMLFR